LIRYLARRGHKHLYHLSWNLISHNHVIIPEENALSGIIGPKDKENVVDQTIQNFVEQKKVAIVGASREGKKFGNAAAKELQERGYEVFFVHPEVPEIDGHPTYPNLEAVKDQAESVWVSVPAEQGEAILRDAAAAGLTKVWLQQGADSPELLQLGKELDLELVSGKCILMYAEPVRSFHKFHQVVWKLFGQY
jgi:predicted CoA-binding protein